ncbi:tetratricopeptide repeat protein [Aggregatilinea lenta]|uniref:tetratricopeptide repeat protein n=1 Tax=Aggregatilinea lenta TaxID=913108 RepID=UPI000E5BB103|nr:tetratricopeptide repeat protein [Aggregatilinea lenta]
MAFEQAEQARQLLQQGIAAARGGRPERARDLLQQAVRLDPQNETTWLWLSSVARDDKERLFCLRQLLTVNPENEFALKGLRALGAEPAAASQPTASPGVPILDDDKYTRLQSEIDTFLHRYTPLPPSSARAQWAHRTRGRYGERGAQRLRMVAFGVATLVVVTLAGALVVAGDSVRELLTGTEVAVRSTSAPPATATPTASPTPGGATPTPFSAQMAVPPTQVPSGVPQGSVYGSTATPVYPALDPSIRIIEGAIDRYSAGDYPNAVGTLDVERESSNPHCYPPIVYYEAMSYLGQGGTQNVNRAEHLLEDALAYQPSDVRYSSCQDAPLVLAGLSAVRRVQGRTNEAVELADQALADDPRLVVALVEKARALHAAGQSDQARSVVSEALTESPNDANLLVMASELTLDAGQPSAALEYAGRALYLNPLLQDALDLQSRIYLRLADGASGQAQEEYFGLAAVSSETMLLHYPGDPRGYLYLAQARIGEEKDDLAEEALSRIIVAADALPDSAEPVIAAAYRLRGDLYYRAGRLAAARDDLQEVAFDDPQAMAQLVDLDLAMGDYSSAAQRIDQLVASNPDNTSYQLLQAKMLVEVCTFYENVTDCDYDGMADLLSDTFIESLGTPRQRADAYSYRAQAAVRLAERRAESLSTAEQNATYQNALNDVNRALDVRETPIDHFYRGLILETLGQTRAALEEYRWLDYWNTLYAYPFVDTAFEQRLAALGGEEDGSPATAQPTEPAGLSATQTPPPTVTPGGSATSASPTPAPSPTSRPTETAEPTSRPAPQLP